MLKGAVLYAKNLDTLTQFYCEIGGKQVDGSEGEFAIIAGSETEFIILQAPMEIASQIVIEDPPAVRAGTPLKPIFQVSSIAEILQTLSEFEARPVPDAKPWKFRQYLVQDIVDPEGNVIQLWQPT